ncbi:MAG: hypothetical protein NW200_04010 [Hyphomonadaceae bacterium]|nr:hypothetical protein [Hyphomonadaceae bacterium]
MTGRPPGSDHGSGHGKRPGGSVIAALVFNACLLMLPFAGAALLKSATAGDLIDYAPTPATIKRTQDALAAEARRFAAAGGADERRQQWNNLVAREMGEGDIAAARGFALNAFVLLGGGDAARMRRQVKPGSGDAGILEAALPFIEPNFARQRFRAVIVRRDDNAAFDVLGDPREIAATSQRWLAGEPVDLFLFTLGGATLPAEGAAPDDVRLGASVIKVAKNGAHLTPAFAAMIETRVASAVPVDRLRAELSSAFQNTDAIVDEGAAAALAFRRAIDPAAYAVLARDLAHIGAAARAASPAGAAILLGQARDARDLRRLELLAVATGERAVAVAKRSPAGLVLDSARGAIRWTEELIGNLVSVGLAVTGLLIATHIAMLNALRGAWEGGGGVPARGAAPLSKAEAQRRARAAAENEKLERVS